jgi:hypothetical protein
MDWSYYLRQRIYLYQGQRLLLAVLVDAWRYHQNDVDAKTDTRAGHEGAVATTCSSLIVTFVMQQFELLHSQIFS